MRRRKRRRRDDEQMVLTPKRREGALAQSAAGQRQRKYGNAYVQRRQSADAEREQQQVEMTPEAAHTYAFDAPSKLDGGQLQLNIARGIDIKNLNVNGNTLPNRIKEWTSVGAFGLSEHEPVEMRGKVKTDGLLNVTLSSEMVQAMGSLTKNETEATAKFDPRNPFGSPGLAVEAAAYFNSAEFAQTIDLANLDKLLNGQEDVTGVFIVLDMQTQFPAPGVGEKRVPFVGQVVLMANF